MRHSLFLKTFALLLAMGSALTCSQSASAQLQSIERPNATTPPAPAADTSAPDTSGIWFFIRRQDADAAQREIDRLRGSYPRWAPTPDMRAAIANLRNPGAGPAAPAVKAATPARPSKQDELEKLIKAGRWSDAEKLAGDDQDLRRIVGDQAAAAANAKAQSGAWDEARALAAVAERQGNSTAGLALGWAALDSKRNADAANTFANYPGNEEAGYGRILALDRAGADIAALSAACKSNALSTRQTEACNNAFAARALAKYQAQQWAGVIEIAEAAVALGLHQSGTDVLAGWSYYRLGQYEKSAAAFDRVRSLEKGAAEGYVLAMMASGQDKAIEQRIAAGDATLAPTFNRQRGALALARKRFLVAEALQGTAETSVTRAQVLTYVRDKSGGNGQDRQDVTGVRVQTDITSGMQQFSLSADMQHIRTGSPAPFSLIGSAGVARFAATTRETLTTPTFKWRDEAIDQVLSVWVGTTPIGGTIDPLPTGRIEAQGDWSNIIVTGALNATPRYDSVLAMAGLRDPVTGRHWGRVIEMGPELNGIFLFSDQFSISTTGIVSHLSGKNVDGNNRYAVNVSGTYQFTSGTLDFLRIGPTYAYQHYSENQNFFTFGQGGYYSPTEQHSAGAYIDLMTAEGQRWQIAARVSGAWTHSIEALRVRYPLADDGTRFNRNTQSEFNTDSTVRGTWLIAPRVMLGAYGRYSKAPSGRDMAAGLSLTFTGSPRDGVYSTDLPRYVDRSWP